MLPELAEPPVRISKESRVVVQLSRTSSCFAPLLTEVFSNSMQLSKLAAPLGKISPMLTVTPAVLFAGRNTRPTFTNALASPGASEPRGTLK